MQISEYQYIVFERLENQYVVPKLLFLPVNHAIVAIGKVLVGRSQDMTTTAHRLITRIVEIMDGDEGMSTAEYAIGTIAAAAFAAVLYAVVTGDSIVTALTAIVHGGAGSWSVVAQGGTSAGCGQAPQQVIADLGQFCAGTGRSTP